MTRFSEMLEEMVVPILSRVPPKTLIRFKCVSKLWYAIIIDPSFVTKNLSISRHNKFASDTCILFQDRSIKNEEEIDAFMRNLDFNNLDLLLSLLHICNGDDDDLTFVLEELDVLFPLSIECQVLPESCVFYDLPPRAEKEDRAAEEEDDDDDDETAPWSNTAVIGFGFDSKAKEYKVVRVVTIVGTQVRVDRAEVYTMGANSWRELKNVDIASSACHIRSASNFVLHLKSSLHLMRVMELLLDQIPVPDCFHFYEDGLDRSLAVLKDSIVLLTYERYENHKSFDIWMMMMMMMDESTGVKGSWTKYLTFGPVEAGIRIY
ncbi:hypothetical protein ACLB2K_050155 [Fragaria x ananassa]